MRRAHSSHNDEHSHNLDILVRNLRMIDEEPRDIHWILREGIWTPEHNQQYASLCDLILVYGDRTTVPVELKACMSKKFKAAHQLEQGCIFTTDELGMTPRYSKFVVYDASRPGQFKFEKINYRRN